MILDSFWSYTVSTVRDNRDRAACIIKSLDKIGISSGPFYYLGPTEEYNSFDYTTAIAVLLASQKQGKNSSSHLQWNTIHHLKTTISNHKDLNNRQFGTLALVEVIAGTMQRFQAGGTSSPWYQQFIQGCKVQMGDVSKKNLALDAKLFKKVIDRIDLKVVNAIIISTRNKWCVAGAYLSFS